MTEIAFNVIVPTLNAGALWGAWWQSLKQQTLRPRRVLVMDSESSDATAAIAAAEAAEVHRVVRGSFNHGGTRRHAVALSADAEILVFLTQDAVLADADALARLVAAFHDPSVGIAYGRQLPRPGAGAIEAHARLFNYPAQSRLVSADDGAALGIKAPFLSNSFSAYRRQALIAAGGFPERVIQSEDMYVGARALQAGWKIAYVGDAAVYHSHAYGLQQDFQRYFDIGAFHAEQPWIRAAFGGAGNEGLRFVRSELRYLLRRAPWLLPSALLRSALKLVGYRLGLRQQRLPLAWRQRLSMQKYYWSSARPDS